MITTAVKVIISQKCNSILCEWADEICGTQQDYGRILGYWQPIPETYWLQDIITEYLGRIPNNNLFQLLWKKVKARDDPPIALNDLFKILAPRRGNLRYQ